MKKGIQKRKIELVNPNDDRGLTYEVFRGEDMQQVTASLRNAGTTSGNHFHKGESPSRNPEINFILQGLGRFEIYDYREGNKEHYEIKVETGDEITILPFVYHILHAVTDLTILERMVVPFDMENKDIYRGLEEYKAHMDSLRA